MDNDEWHIGNRPTTYWELRCNLLDKALYHAVATIQFYLPPAAQEDLAAIFDTMDVEIEKLDEQFCTEVKKKNANN